MNLWYSINLYFFALCEFAINVFPDDFWPSLKRWTFIKIAKFALAVRSFNALALNFFFPVRGNFMNSNHIRRTILIQCVELDEEQKSVVRERTIILPPSTTVYDWNYVEGVYEDGSVDEFSSTEEEDADIDDNFMYNRKSLFITVDLTDMISQYQGAYKDFYGCPITPRMIDSELHKLIFYKKNAKTGEIIKKIEFPSNAIIKLDQFE